MRTRYVAAIYHIYYYYLRYNKGRGGLQKKRKARNPGLLICADVARSGFATGRNAHHMRTQSMTSARARERLLRFTLRCHLFRPPLIFTASHTLVQLFVFAVVVFCLCSAASQSNKHDAATSDLEIALKNCDDFVRSLLPIPQGAVDTPRPVIDLISAADHIFVISLNRY